jgi:hypothetical protein
MDTQDGSTNGSPNTVVVEEMSNISGAAVASDSFNPPVVVIRPKASLKERLFGSPTGEFNGSHYLLMYAISLGLLASVLSSMASLLEICFNYVGKDDTASQVVYGGYTTKFIAWLIIIMAVSLPVYIFLMYRLRKLQPQEVPSFTRRVRGFLFGGFMTVLGLATVSSFANIIYSIVVPLLPKDDFVEAGAWWPGVLQAILMTLLLAAAFWYQLRAFRGNKEL